MGEHWIPMYVLVDNRFNGLVANPFKPLTSIDMHRSSLVDNGHAVQQRPHNSPSMRREHRT